MPQASPERDEQPGTPGEGEASARRLTRVQFWGIFAIGVVIFLFSTGPVWQHPWRIDTLNMAILYSYLPLPFLVAGALAYKKRLGLKAFFIDTLEILLLKYGFTFGTAIALWTLFPAPMAKPVLVAAPPSSASIPPERVEPAPPPTPIPEDQRGTISGVVTTRDGTPREGGLVYIASGLEKYVFAAPETPLVLENDGSGIRPRVAAVVFRQPLSARSADGHLHTLLAVKDGSTLLNVPLLSSAEPSPVRFLEAHGVMELRCRVHPGEQVTTLGVFSHPFFAVTGPDGAFSFAGVPAGTFQIVVRIRGFRDGAAEVPLRPRGVSTTKIEVASQPE
jgi:hypothetical protein